MINLKEQKFFAMFDAPSEGERHNAVDLFCGHLKNNGRSSRGIIAEIEECQAARAKAEDLNARAKQAHDRQAREIAQLKAIIVAAFNVKSWLVFNRGRVAAGAAVLAVAVAGYNFFGPGTGAAAVAERAAADKAFKGVLQSTAWSEGETEPRVFTGAGKPYWVVMRGEIENDLHADMQGRAVEMRCSRLYATPAAVDFGAYVKVGAYNSFGWLSWPERAKHCRAVAIEKADKS